MPRTVVLYSGDVQGVGFRFRTLRLAQAYAVTGYVQNLSDGRVELVCEGKQAEVDSFLREIRETMKSHLHHVDVQSLPATDEFIGFVIR